eukprot:g4322.t1
MPRAIVGETYKSAKNRVDNDKKAKGRFTYFLETARRQDVKYCKILTKKNVTKFKIRCSRYLYTLTVDDKEKADRLKASIPPRVEKKELN